MGYCLGSEVSNYKDEGCVIFQTSEWYEENRNVNCCTGGSSRHGLAIMYVCWHRLGKSFCLGTHSLFSIFPWPFSPFLKTGTTQTRGVETGFVEGSCHVVSLWEFSISWHICDFIAEVSIANCTGTYCVLKSETTLCLWTCDIMLIIPCSHQFGEKCLVYQKASWAEWQQLL